MAILGALLLIVVLLVRPMEIVPALGKLHLLETFTGLTAVGVLFEATTRKERLGVPPQLPWLLGFLGWAYFVTIARVGFASGFAAAWNVTLPVIFMVVVSFAMVSASRLRLAATVLTATLAAVAFVAVHQGMQPRQCVEVTVSEGDEELVPDGRDCEGPRSCERGAKEGAEFVCERVGMLGTLSVGGRVRYRGQMADPNELSVFLGAGLPFALMLGGDRSKWIKRLIVWPIVLLCLWAVVLSQSRTGQMVLGVLALIALVRRYGPKGVVFAAAVMFPMLLLGGREGAEADASSLERATILYDGIDLVRAHPFLGVGVGEFVNEISIPMTAHNSYLLAAAELGPLGLVLWGGLLWISMKTAVTVATSPPQGVDPELSRFAEAMISSLAAIFVGIFFLSFCYKQLLFVWLGLAAGLHGAVRAQAPSFRVTTTRRDVGGLLAFCALVLIAVFVISRVKTAG